MKILIIVGLVFIVGCATTPLPPVPTEANVIVSVPCITADQVPVPPRLLTDAELRALDDFRYVLMHVKERLEREGYEQKLEALLKACVR